MPAAAKVMRSFFDGLSLRFLNSYLIGYFTPFTVPYDDSTVTDSVRLGTSRYTVQ